MHRLRLGELLAYALFVAAVIGFAFFTFERAPVTYARLIAEDAWGESATALGFAAATLLLGRLALRPGPGVRRIAWAVMALGCFVLGGEEISWGQRIFDFGVPEAVSEVNLQGEINLHNLEAMAVVQERGHEIAAYAVVLWLALSAALEVARPARFAALAGRGVPLIPLRISPFLLPIPLYFLADLTVKNDEIGEMFLGLSTAVFALDLTFQHAHTPPWTGGSAMARTFAMLALIAGLAVAVSGLSVDQLAIRLNLTAARDYPQFGMLAQAEEIFEYLYAHPRLMRPDTRLDHGRLLLAEGRPEDARARLEEAAAEIEAAQPTPAERADAERRLGQVYTLLDRDADAAAAFARSVGSDRAALAQATGGTPRARLLWSIAKTLAIAGDGAGALEAADDAIAAAQHGALRKQIEWWRGDLRRSLGP